MVALHATAPVSGQAAHRCRDANHLYGTQRKENHPAHPAKLAAGRRETGSSDLLRREKQQRGPYPIPRAA